MLNLNFQSVADNQYTIVTDQLFWNFTSAFGGWVAAVAISAVKTHDEFRGEIITEQMQFIGPVKGQKISVVVDLQARRRQIDFWRVTVSDCEGQILVTADIVAGERANSDISYNTLAPKTNATDNYAPLEASMMTPSWLSSFEQYMAEGKPGSINDQPRSVVLLRTKQQCNLNAPVLAMICDTPMPRTFFASDKLRFASTISLATHIYGSDSQISDAGRDFLIVETDSAAIRNNTANQEVHVFRKDGLLLATSYQTSIFR